MARRPLLYRRSGCGIVLPTPYDDEFDCGTSIDTTGGRFSGANAWTLLNQRGGSAPQSGGQLSLTCATSANTHDPIIAVQSLSGDGVFQSTGTVALGGPNFAGLGIALRESSTGKMLCFGASDDVGYKFQVRRVPNGSTTTFTNWTANYNAADGTAPTNLTGWYEVERKSGTLIFVSSLDGSNWREVFRVAQTADFTTAPNQVGLWTNQPSSSPAITVGVFDYFLKNPTRSLPYGVPISNPSATLAIAAPWTNVTNVLQTRGSVGRGGSPAFAITSVGAFECYQEWAPTGFDTIFDSGTTTATFAGWGAPWTGATTSYHIEIAAYDAGGSQLATASSGTWTPSATFSQKNCAITIPATTRKLRMTWKGTCTAAQDGWLDDLTLNLT